MAPTSWSGQWSVSGRSGSDQTRGNITDYQRELCKLQHKNKKRSKKAEVEDEEEGLGGSDNEGISDDGLDDGDYEVMEEEFETGSKHKVSFICICIAIAFNLSKEVKGRTRCREKLLYR